MTDENTDVTAQFAARVTARLTGQEPGAILEAAKTGTQTHVEGQCDTAAVLMILQLILDAVVLIHQHCGSIDRIRGAIRARHMPAIAFFRRSRLAKLIEEYEPYTTALSINAPKVIDALIAECEKTDDGELRDAWGELASMEWQA